MIYYEFINKTNKYLKSVRVLKNYVSFDMVFPSSWIMLKKAPETMEILQNEGESGTITSFVCEMNKKNIDILEDTLDSVIKTNIEREEKEKLFKTKVNELKSIFENEKLDSLKSLKFDIDDITKLLQNGSQENGKKSDKRVEQA